jgi:RNA polymerase sigma-70 factor (ECF subfamily)
MGPSLHISQTVDHLFRHESGKMVAVLSRLLGLQHLEVAQDLVQDSLVQAMTTWPYSGMPDNPAGWLHRVARNKAIDYLRREKRRAHIHPQYARLLQSEYTLAATLNHLFLESEIRDSVLRLLFACCHPAIQPEAQMALALKMVCGLSTGEIAKAFLTSEETIAKRIYRAREKIRTEKIELDLPPLVEMQSRLEAVWHCLYLLFNEGYNSSHPDQLIRAELCEEAMRLAYLLSQQKISNTPRTNALLSLFCFQASRFEARVGSDASIVLLRHQNRSKWHQPLIEKGFAYLEAAAEPFEVSSYHLEAAIASLHAAAPSFAQTDWPAIYHLYKALYAIHPGPVVAFNKAIASAYAVSREAALPQLLAIKELEENHLYHTAIGEMYFELAQKDQAKERYEQALRLTASRQEQQLLRDKIRQC